MHPPAAWIKVQPGSVGLCNRIAQWAADVVGEVFDDIE